MTVVLSGELVLTCSNAAQRQRCPVALKKKETYALELIKLNKEAAIQLKRVKEQVALLNRELNPEDRRLHDLMTEAFETLQARQSKKFNLLAEELMEVFSDASLWAF